MSAPAAAAAELAVVGGPAGAWRRGAGVRPSMVTCGTATAGLSGAVVCGEAGVAGVSGVVVGGLAGGVAGGVVAGVPFAGGVCAVATPARLNSTRAEPPRRSKRFRRIDIAVPTVSCEQRP